MYKVVAPTGGLMIKKTPPSKISPLESAVGSIMPGRPPPASAQKGGKGRVCSAGGWERFEESLKLLKHLKSS